MEPSPISASDWGTLGMPPKVEALTTPTRHHQLQGSGTSSTCRERERIIFEGPAFFDAVELLTKVTFGRIIKLIILDQTIKPSNPSPMSQLFFDVVQHGREKNMKPSPNPWGIVSRIPEVRMCFFPASVAICMMDVKTTGLHA